MKIREAEIKDIQVWSDMRKELWADPKNQNQSELNEYFSGNSKNVRQAFICEIEGKVIGFIEINIRKFVEGSNNEKVPYIEAWYIHPDFQGQGNGRQLIKVAERWALKNGFTELGSDTQIENHNSIQVHKHLGFKETERIVCFLKQLK